MISLHRYISNFSQVRLPTPGPVSSVVGELARNEEAARAGMEGEVESDTGKTGKK